MAKKRYKEFRKKRNDNDFFSPTTWDRLPEESDEDYQDRIQDQEDLMDYYND